MEIRTRTGLAELVARYIEAGLPIASANLLQGELVALPGGRWKPTGAPGHFQREQTGRVMWSIAIDHRKDRLHALSAYRDVVAFIEANESWSKQFGGLVGTVHSRGRLDMEQFVDGCLGAAMAALAESRDPVEAALGHTAKIERFLDATEVSVETFAPLLGFNSFGLGRVEFGPDLVIDPIDEDDLERLFHVGLLLPTMPNFPFVWAPSHMVLSSYRSPKVVGDADPPQEMVLADPGKPAKDAIDELVVCLRLFRPGVVAAGAAATELPPPFGGYQWGGERWQQPVAGRSPMPALQGYVIGPRDVDELLELWRHMHTPGFLTSAQLRLATRRFAYKGDRSRVDDQLVDLIVAAESLFLGDGDDESRGELRYRLSSRAAWYLSGAGRSRRFVFKLFMAAYRMRSRLVHGSTAEPMRVAGEEFTAERMVEALEAMLRHALRQAIAEAAKGSAVWRVEWEQLLFPEPSPTVSAPVLPDGSG